MRGVRRPGRSPDGDPPCQAHAEMPRDLRVRSPSVLHLQASLAAFFPALLPRLSAHGSASCSSDPRIPSPAFCASPMIRTQKPETQAAEMYIS